MRAFITWLRGNMGSPDPHQGQSQSPLQKLLKASTRQPFADCVLVSDSGDKFYTYKGLLHKHSNVFKEMFESCDTPESGAAPDDGAHELQLPDASASIEAATTYIIDTDAFWSAATESDCAELLEVLASLIRFAHKYDMEGICRRVDHFLTQNGAIINIINSGLLFKAWELVSSFQLVQSQGVLEAHLTKDPAAFVNQFDAGIPPSCDHMRSALTVGHFYATKLRNLEERHTKLKLRNTELVQCDEPGRKELADRYVKRMVEYEDRAIWLGIGFGIMCLVVGSFLGISSQQPREHVLHGVLQMGWSYIAIYIIFILVAMVGWISSMLGAASAW